MSVLVGSDTRLVIQGITGTEGTFHGQQMIDYGTNVVAGVTPGKAARKPWAYLYLMQSVRLSSIKMRTLQLSLSRRNLLPVLLLKRLALVWIWSYASLRAFQL